MTDPFEANSGDDAPLILPKDWMTVSSDEAREDLRATRLAQAHVPRKYMGKSLDNFVARDKARKRIVEEAREYVRHFHQYRGEAEGLLIQGRVGCGKTHIAVAILREVIAAGYSGLYCNIPEFFKEVRASYSYGSGLDESELIEETRGVDLLVLDDLGVEGRVVDPVRDRSKWLCERLYLIVNGRYEASRPVIVTTNCSLESLVDQIDERTVSRLAEMTRRRLAAFPDEDYRKKHLR